MDFPGFLGWASGKETAVPALGRSPGGGHGHPLQHPCLENPMVRGAWRATVHGVAKSQTRLSTCTHTHAHTHIPVWRHSEPLCIKRRSPNISPRADVSLRWGLRHLSLWKLRQLKLRDRETKRKEFHKERVPEICTSFHSNLWLNIHRPPRHGKTPGSQA